MAMAMSLLGSSNDFDSFSECDDDDVSNLLECCICLEMCQVPIHQCKNGHNICASHIHRLIDCPICREPYSKGGGRNLLAERLVQSKQERKRQMKILNAKKGTGSGVSSRVIMAPQCRYFGGDRYGGCLYENVQPLITLHEVNCHYRPIVCCLSTDGCSNAQIPFEDYINHLKTIHKVKTFAGDSHLQKYFINKSDKLVGDGSTSMFILESGGNTFLVRAQTDQFRRICIWVAIHGRPEERLMFTARIRFVKTFDARNDGNAQEYDELSNGDHEQDDYDDREQDNYDDREPDNYDDHEQDDHDDLEQDNYDDREQDNYDDREQDNYDDREQDDYDDLEQDIYDDREQDNYDDREQDDYDDLEQDNYDDREQDDYDDLEQDNYNYDDREQDDYNDLEQDNYNYDDREQDDYDDLEQDNYNDCEQDYDDREQDYDDREQDNYDDREQDYDDREQDNYDDCEQDNYDEDEEVRRRNDDEQDLYDDDERSDYDNRNYNDDQQYGEDSLYDGDAQNQNDGEGDSTNLNDNVQLTTRRNLDDVKALPPVNTLKYLSLAEDEVRKNLITEHRPNHQLKYWSVMISIFRSRDAEGIM